MSKAKIREAKKRYAESAGRMVEDCKENFNSKKLEDSEKIKFIVASDVACLTLSDKRAYIDGNYIGSSQDKNSDVINLDAIKRVETSKKYRVNLLSHIIIILVALFAMIGLCTMFYNNYVESEDILHSTYIDVGHEGDDFYGYYSRHKYLSKEEIDARHEDNIRNQAAREALGDRKRKAESDQQIDLIGGFIVVCVGFWLMIHTMLKIHRSQYSILSIETDNKSYGLEIRDPSITEQVRNIVLVAKSNKQSEIDRADVAMIQQQQKSINYVGSDKVSKLTELSHLYEQGLIQQEEFEQLKKEILSV